MSAVYPVLDGCLQHKDPTQTPRKETPPCVELLPEVLSLEEKMIDTRRQIHRRPEMKFEEVETAALVADRLRSFGMEVTEEVGITGVVGLLRGTRPGPERCIALRADMDALPLQEDVDSEFKSEIDGVMHGCGHDGHVAMLLCAAEILSQEADRISGVVKFIFQPAEENGGAGALQMINDGVLQNPAVDEIYGIHLRSYRRVYEAEILLGPVQAQNDRFQITIEGAGGHGSAPQQTQDVIYIASVLNLQLQGIVSREIPALESGVLTITQVHAGTTYNVIPTTTELAGTMRTFSLEIRNQIAERIRAFCNSISDAYGVKVTFEFVLISYPPVINAYEDQYNSSYEAITDIIGVDGIVADGRPTMGSEDFSYFLNEVPGCFFHVGSSAALPAPGQHSATYFIDERCLAVGASYWVKLVRNILENDKTEKLKKTKPSSQQISTVTGQQNPIEKEIVDDGFIIV